MFNIFIFLAHISFFKVFPQEEFDKVFVFDLYRGKGVPEGKKSLAITLTLYAEDHTLKDEEIALSVKKAIDALSRKFLAEIRS